MVYSALLPAEAAHLGHGHAMHANSRERRAHRVELMRLNHCDDVFHGTRPQSHVVAAFAAMSEVKDPAPRSRALTQTCDRLDDIGNGKAYQRRP